jgi:hypothetical protein
MNKLYRQLFTHFKLVNIILKWPIYHPFSEYIEMTILISDVAINCLGIYLFPKNMLGMTLR